MDVGILEARDKQSTGEIDDLGPGADVLYDVSVRTDRRNGSTPNGNGLRP